MQDNTLLGFETQNSRVEDYKVTEAVLNGVPLSDLVRGEEMEQAHARGLELMAGRYDGLPPLMVLPPSCHFFNQPHQDYQRKDKTVLLVSGVSGVPGEFDVCCSIRLEKDWVIWSDFEHYSEIIPAWNAWHYELGPFVFERSAYEATLLHASKTAY